MIDEKWQVEYYTIKPADTALKLIKAYTKESASEALDVYKRKSKWPNAINVFKHLSCEVDGMKRYITRSGI